MKEPAMPMVIKQRYEILELIGIGGEGRVVKALDRQHGRLVALKVRPVKDDQAREELLSEARILLAVPPHPAVSSGISVRDMPPPLGVLVDQTALAAWRESSGDIPAEGSVPKGRAA